MGPILRMTAAASAACAAGLAYASIVEPRWFVVRRFDIPVLPAGSKSLRVLHLSDVHMMPDQRIKQHWLSGLAELEPDLVVNTGDNLSHADALPSVLRSYGELLDLPGVFVFGSNDYFSPRRPRWTHYLRGGSGVDVRGPWGRDRDLPFEQMRQSFTQRGWIDLTNRHDSLEIDGHRVAFVGVDDPHLKRDVLDDQPADPNADLTIGVTHAPYLRVLDRWNMLGYQLLLAGHTHGGQLRLPFYGAIVTNCDLDPARARGVSRHAVDGHDPSWMHVCAGAGSSPYAPVRFACRPEASLLTLTAIDSPGSP